MTLSFLRFIELFHFTLDLFSPLCPPHSPVALVLDVLLPNQVISNLLHPESLETSFLAGLVSRDMPILWLKL